MTIENVLLELIDDNPFQPRESYPRNKVDEIAYSIEQVGLIHQPLARRRNGRFEIAEGHLRKRAYLKLQNKNHKKWSEMPLNVREISDEEMARIALEENLRRQDITPLDLARSVDRYLTTFTDKTETGLAKSLNMTQGNISNMRRVLKLPTKVLEKIEEGKLNFTMGRELLIFQGLDTGKKDRVWSRKATEYIDIPIDEEYLMLAAIRYIASNQYSGQPATVDGIKRAIDHVANAHFKHLYRDRWSEYRDPLFDVTDCRKCPKAVKTWETKSNSRYHCTDPKCWERKQEAHQKKEAAEAKKHMEEDIARRVAQAERERQESDTISQEIPEDIGPVAIEEEPAATRDELEKELEAEGIDTGVIDIYSSIPEEEREQARRRFKQVGNRPNWPCHSCLNIGRCDGTSVRAVSGSGDNEVLACSDHMGIGDEPKVKKVATVELPPEIKDKIGDKAGTRAEVLDLRKLRTGSYGDLKQGYVLLKGPYEELLKQMLEPEECTDRCTYGFHYAYDSDRDYGFSRGESQPKTFFVCTNPKCVAKKKAGFTRALNAAGMAKKKAEAAAIKQAVDTTTRLDHARLKVIIYGFIHTDRLYYYSNDREIDWFVKKLKIDKGKIPGTGLGATDAPKLQVAVLEKIDHLSEEELAKLILEFTLLKLTYSGDIKEHKILTTQPLNWMGIGINIPKTEANRQGEQKHA